MLKSLFLSNDRLFDHGDLAHPENSDRLRAILEAFKKTPYQKFLDLSLNRLAQPHELTLVHDLAYVSEVLSFEGKEISLDHETFLSPGSVTAALLAAGLGLELVEQVLALKIQNGFSLVRPPGHHAKKGAAMGFCVFNNIAIAAKQAMAMGVKRVLILDWDVHHGNGTQEAFYADERVLLIDLHQDNLFPYLSGTLEEAGVEKGQGFTVNIPLPAHCQDQDYFYVFDRLVKPLAIKYRPELILVSAGFDAHESDPMGSMHLTTKAYGMLTKKVKMLANDLCEGKVVFFLEGGYNPFFLAKNVMECIGVLAEEFQSYKIKEENHTASLVVERLVERICESFI